MPAFSIHHSTLSDLDAATLYRLMQLRTDVFVVEQGITAEPELDGLDLARDTLLVWAEDASAAVISELRLLGCGSALAVIGRVATAQAARGQGVAAALVRFATAEAFARGARAVELHAQAHLEQWYAGLGYIRVGEPFDEAGIAHVLMRRTV